MEADGKPMSADEAIPDSVDRTRDFLARHGGAGAAQPREEIAQAGLSGWSEVYALDGYVLRCEWSRTGGKQESTFSEIPP